MGARALAAATQRLPPVHRRPPPLGGGKPGGAPRRSCGATRPLGDRGVAARPRQGLPGRSHRTGRGARCSHQPPYGLRRARYRVNWWRSGASPPAACPMSPPVGISTTRRRSTWLPRPSARSGSSICCTRSPRLTRWPPVRRPGAHGRPSSSRNWSSGFASLGCGQRSRRYARAPIAVPNSRDLGADGCRRHCRRRRSAPDRRRQRRPPGHVRPPRRSAGIARHRRRRCARTQRRAGHGRIAVQDCRTRHSVPIGRRSPPTYIGPSR